MNNNNYRSIKFKIMMITVQLKRLAEIKLVRLGSIIAITKIVGF